MRNQKALAGYAESLKNQSPAEVKLFHFSEQEGLDTMKLIEALHENVSRDPCEVSILFTITASSSFLFFDQEHHPRHVELCSELKRFHLTHPFDKVNFITCPTTKEAMKAPSLDQPCYGEFKHFATMADTWWNFKSDQHVDSNQISSLIQTSRDLQSTRLASKPLEDVNPLRCVSPRAGFFLLGIIAHWLFSDMFAPHTLPEGAYPIPPLRTRNDTMDEHLQDAEVFFRTHVEELERKVELKNDMVQMLQKKLQAENQTNSGQRETAQTWKLQFEKSQRLLQPLEKQLKTKNESIQQLQEQHEKQIQEENTTEQKVYSLKIRIQTLMKQNEAQTIHEWNIATDIIFASMMFCMLFLVVYCIVSFVCWHQHEEVQKPSVSAETSA